MISLRDGPLGRFASIRPGRPRAGELDARDCPEGCLECLPKAPQIATQIIVTRSLRLRRAHYQVWSLVSLRVAGRVARTLLDLALGHGDHVAAGVPIVLHFTR